MQHATCPICRYDVSKLFPERAVALAEKRGAEAQQAPASGGVAASAAVRAAPDLQRSLAPEAVAALASLPPPLPVVAQQSSAMGLSTRAEPASVPAEAGADIDLEGQSSSARQAHTQSRWARSWARIRPVVAR